jgi:predicted O-methyltransferase YrrM
MVTKNQTKEDRDKEMLELVSILENLNTHQVEGWLAPDEGALLYMAAKSCTEGAIVEIGAWKGKSTIFLAKGSKAGNNVKIHSIDPHTGASEQKAVDSNIWTYPEFKTNIHALNVDDIIAPIVKTSAEAAKEWDMPIELLFIDGAHEYDLVKQDFELWVPHVIKNGMVLMHDTNPDISLPGPVRVCKEYLFDSGDFYDFKYRYSLAFARKK